MFIKALLPRNNFSSLANEKKNHDKYTSDGKDCKPCYARGLDAPRIYFLGLYIRMTSVSQALLNCPFS